MYRSRTILRAVASLLFTCVATTVIADPQSKPPKKIDITSEENLLRVGEPPCRTRQYEVQEGDTLGSIADETLGMSDSWPEIWLLNPSVIDPDVIHPKQSLRVPQCGPEELWDIYNHHSIYQSRFVNLDEKKLSVEAMLPYLNSYSLADVAETVTITSETAHVLSSDASPPSQPPAPVPEAPPERPPVPLPTSATAPTTSTGSGSEQTPPTRKLHWNAWLVENEGKDTSVYDKDKVVDVLHRNTTYTLSLDIALADYLQRVVSKPIGERTEEVLQRVIATGTTVPLEAVVLTEDEYFRPPTSRRIPFQLSATAIKTALAASTDGDPLTLLKENPNRDFILSHKTIDLTTTGSDVLGPTTVVIAVLKDGIPLVELRVEECFNGTTPNDCGGGGLYSTGVFEVPISTSGTEAYASLLLIQTSPEGHIDALLHRPAKPGQEEYISWSPPISYDDLKNSLNRSLMTALNASITLRNETEIKSAGNSIFLQLFGSKPPRFSLPFRSRKESPASKAMRELLLDRKSASSRVPLHVRVVPYSGEAVPLLPFALLAIDDVEGPGTLTLVGSYFRIETPAPTVRYEASESCVHDWLMVMPAGLGGDTELQTAVTKASAAYDWTKKKDVRYFCDLDQFSAWMGGGDLQKTICPDADPTAAPVSDAPPANPNALMLLSHSGNDLISLDEKKPPMPAGAFRKRLFGAPSFAFLNACGTAGPASPQLISILNAQGFGGFIATAAQVNGDVAGDFASALVASIPDDGIKLRDALEKAYTTLQAQKKDFPFDLVYTLVGNGDIKLCPPAARKSQSPATSAPLGGLQ